MTEISEDVEIQKFDIKKVFYEKSPRIARLMPGFIYTYLKKILHQDFVNYFLEKHGDKIGLDFMEAAYKEFNVDMNIMRSESPRGRSISLCRKPSPGRI